MRVLEHAREHGVVTTMDVLSHVDEATFARFADALQYVDYFFPNHHQVLTMTGTATEEEAADALLARGVGCLVLTRGAEGSRIIAPGTSIDLPSSAVEMVDTTGCGDAYAAGFIVGTLSGWDLRTRGLFGSACAALVGSGLGSDAGIVDLEQAKDFLSRMAPEESPAPGPSLSSIQEGEPHA